MNEITQKVPKLLRKYIKFCVVFWKHCTARKNFSDGCGKFQLWKELNYKSTYHIVDIPLLIVLEVSTSLSVSLTTKIKFDKILFQPKITLSLSFKNLDDQRKFQLPSGRGQRWLLSRSSGCQRTCWSTCCPCWTSPPPGPSPLSTLWPSPSSADLFPGVDSSRDHSSQVECPS